MRRILGAMASGNTTRPTLLQRVRDPEDAEAWREFDERYRLLILRYCQRRGLQAADAEDVRQLVMMSMAQSLRGFRYAPERGRFRAYLGQTVRNAIPRLQGAARHISHNAGDVELAATDAGDVDAVWEREWVQHHFRRAMHAAAASFEPQSIEVFEHLRAGESPAEVARGFGLTVSAVYKIRTRIRDHLRGTIAAQVREEEAHAAPTG
ncbi:MAG: sigma-70 family RNA polymerase sigma factor [Planctomycetota bacterium]